MAAAVLALAERLGWPRVPLTGTASVGPGEDRWRLFVARGTHRRMMQAHAALMALPDKAPEPRIQRLV